MSEPSDITPEAIKAWRTERGYKIAQAARKIDAPASTWLRWESGETTPSEEYKVKLRKLFERGDMWTHVSDETTKALRLFVRSPRLADFMIDGLLTVFDDGPNLDNRSLEYARTWFENEFVRRKPRKLTGVERDIFRQTSVFSLYAGYGVAAVKYATEGDEIKKWGHAVDWLFMDLTGLQHHIKSDLWFEAFEAHFATGYALGVSEFHDRLGEEIHGFAPMPHSFAGERAVLGCALMDPNMRPHIMETLSVDDFYEDTHRLTFQAVDALYSRHQPVNPVSVTAEMRNQGTLESIGGPGQLRQMANNVPDFKEAMDWMKLIKQKSVQRQIIVTAKVVMKGCYSEVGPADPSVGRLAKAIDNFKSMKSGAFESSPDPNT